MHRRTIGLGLVLISLTSAHAETVRIDATLDTAFLDTLPSNNFGINWHVPVGLANNASARRAVFFLDVAAAIPAGAVINGATFEFDVYAQGGPSGQQAETFVLHRVTTPWLEGTGNTNVGQATGDGATWTMASPSTPWSTPGGDFVSTPSGSVFIDYQGGGFGVTYAAGNAQLVADVQAMLDDPGQNFGFLLKALTESRFGSAMRVAARENPEPDLGTAARLIVDFTPPTPCADTNDDTVIDFADLLNVLSDWGPCPGCPTDLDGDGDVGFADLLLILSSWDGTCG